MRPCSERYKLNEENRNENILQTLHFRRLKYAFRQWYGSLPVETLVIDKAILENIKKMEACFEQLENSKIQAFL